jgi:hypothetical protein
MFIDDQTKKVKEGNAVLYLQIQRTVLRILGTAN